MDLVKLLFVAGLGFVITGVVLFALAAKKPGDSPGKHRVYGWVVYSGFVLWIAAFSGYLLVQHTQSDKVYSEFVLSCEEFDLVCSNLETVTYPLARKVYSNAEKWNAYIVVGRKAQGGLTADFYNERVVSSPTIILSKMRYSTVCQCQ